MANTRKASSDYIDFNALLKSYLSKWPWFVVSVLICGTFGYLATRMNQRPMAVRANILISQEDDGPFGVSSSAPAVSGMGSLFGSSAYVEDEIFVISSHSLYRNVAKALTLNKQYFVTTGFLRTRQAYPEFPVDVMSAVSNAADTLSTTLTFKVKVNEAGKAEIKVKGGRKNKTLVELDDVTLPCEVKTPYGDYSVIPTANYPKGREVNTTILFSGYESAAENLTDQVLADLASKKSNVITLSFDHPNAAYASAVLNELLKQYNERGIYEKRLSGQKTATFLEDRIDIIGHDLDLAESAIQNFKTGHNIIDIEADAVMQAEKKSALSEKIFEQEAEVEILRITRDFFADSLAASELVPAMVNNEILQRGIDSLNTMIVNRIALTQNAKSDNVSLRMLDRRIALSRQNLLRSTNKILEQSTLKLCELQREQGKADSFLGSIPTQEREYVSLKRHQAMKEHLYTFLLERQEENAMMLANSLSKGKVIDEAYTLTQPLGISNKAILLIALIIGLCLPPIALFLYKIIRNKFEDRKEVERYVSAPILGEMCIDKSGRKMVVTEDDTTSATELFRLLRSNLQFMLSDPADRVVLVTSTVSGEGKSFISSNLAASLSLLADQKVLLVGMDIRNPQLENYLDIHPRFGLTNYLSSSEVTLDQLIVPMPGYKNLDIVVAGPIPPNPSELLASDKIDSLFANLRGKYDFIIVDSAPVGMVSDTFTLDRIADATVYVTRVNYSSINDLHFIENIYEDKRLKKLSVVVNGTHAKKGYGYGYGRGHKGTKIS
ncbi:MAG: polysaccharide biosynthesis tyrosine autokinase [Duncaniella sp.]|nr:polysaccharide biosynthesis tyrosine autokinase [Duncaniella sp.]